MIIAPHLLVGAAISLKIKNIFLIAPLALLSHYLMDAVYHYDYPLMKGFKKKNEITPKIFLVAFLDFSAGFLGGIFLSISKHPLPQLAILGMFFAVLPDVLILFYYLIKNSSNVPAWILRLLKFHDRIHSFLHYPVGKKTPTSIVGAPLFPGIISEIVFTAVAAIVILI